MKRREKTNILPDIYKTREMYVCMHARKRLVLILLLYPVIINLYNSEKIVNKKINESNNTK